MSFGKKLKILRAAYNLDQAQMSKKLSVSQPVYSRYENDEKQVSESSEFVKRVVDEFAVTYQWLLTDELPIEIIGNKYEKNTVNATVQNENYYSLPKDFVDLFFKQQQQMIEMILNKLRAGGELNQTLYYIQ